MKLLVAAVCVFAVGVNAQVGHSGIVRPDGVNTQFSHDLAQDILLIGPSGIVTKSGANLQLTDDLRIVNPRFRRSAGFVSQKGNVGTSGILRADGSTDLFSHDFAHDIVLIGPSGIVTKSGVNSQLNTDLHRVKRHLIGESGIVTKKGQLIQLPAGAKVVLVGPSGILLSNGQNVQLN